MSSRLLPKNNYLISQRNYLEDYFNGEKKEIDMTISGKFIVPFPEFNIDVRYDRYLESTEIDELIALIRNKYAIKNEIVIGAGSNGLLQNILKVLMHQGGNLVTPFYSFDEAEYACSSYECFTKRVFCKNYEIDFEGLENAIDINTKCVYICNNPTGIYEDANKIITFSKKVKVPVIVDESCIDFSLEKSVLDFEYPRNIIVLRTFSKAFGLANLRIGFMICNEDFKKEYLKKVTINEVSSIAVRCAKKMINNKAVDKNIKKVIKERERLKKELSSLKIECIDSSSSILLTKKSFKIGDRISLVNVYDENNELHYRIAIQEESVNEEFIRELKRVL